MTGLTLYEKTNPQKINNDTLLNIIKHLCKHYGVPLPKIEHVSGIASYNLKTNTLSLPKSSSSYYGVSFGNALTSAHEFYHYLLDKYPTVLVQKSNEIIDVRGVEFKPIYDAEEVAADNFANTWIRILRTVYREWFEEAFKRRSSEYI